MKQNKNTEVNTESKPIATQVQKVKSPKPRTKDLVCRINEEGDLQVKYIDELVDSVLDKLIAGKMSFEQALVGYENCSGRPVYDRCKMFDLMLAYGYCLDCASTFLDIYCDLDNDDAIFITSKFQDKIWTLQNKFSNRNCSKASK